MFYKSLNYTGLQVPGGWGIHPPTIFDLYSPDNFDFYPLLSVKEFEQKMGRKKAGPGTTKDRKTKITSRNLKIIPPPPNIKKVTKIC